jgi:hypothetical protein
MNGGTGVVHVTASEVKRGLASATYAMESETFDDRYWWRAILGTFTLLLKKNSVESRTRL